MPLRVPPPPLLLLQRENPRRQQKHMNLQWHGFVMVLVVLSLLLLCACCAHGLDASEVTALTDIKNELTDPSGSLAGWGNATAGACTWPGVRCGARARHVTQLDLSQMNLSGNISDGILGLRHLRVLNLSRNAFSGRLPVSLFRLPNLLVLDVNHNFFAGEFPAGVSGLANLAVFSAYSNNFSGPLPLEFANLSALEVLNLGGSYFNGSIPASYGSFPRLRYLHLAGNELTGRIPAALGNILSLQHLEIGYNSFSGGIPSALGNMSSLEYLDISEAFLTGPLPAELGKLIKLRTLLLFRNVLNGSIPAEITRLVNLARLDLSCNVLSGSIPRGFDRLKRLCLIHLMSNSLNGSIPAGIGDLTKLEYFKIWNNSFTGSLPAGLGRHSALKEVDVSSNFFNGLIPRGLCDGGKLVKLIMFSNRFSGSIPPELAQCHSLYRLRIEDNRLTGTIPRGFGSLPNLTFVDLSMNDLRSGIPPDLSGAASLQLLNVSHNPSLGGRLPREMWGTPSLQIFSAAHSGISGTIPSFKSCGILYRIELQGNRLTGLIPADVRRCQKLLNLLLSENEIAGTIPAELTLLPSITELDLSRNRLVGTIPANFDNCSTLEMFNVSFNRLSGPVPEFGPLFRNINVSSFLGNSGLCGGVLRTPCDPPASEMTSTSPTKVGPVAWVLVPVFAVVVCIVIVGSRCFYKQYKWYINGYRTEHDEGQWKITAFQRLNFTVDDILECLKSSNIIGMGSAGTVYRADMPNGETIAVKKLWKNSGTGGPHKLPARRRRGVLAEVDLLGNVRHRNIVRLLGCCSNNEVTLLLYEYMPNGSLADLLHGGKASNILGDWMTRYKIAVGVAQGLKYLHHDFYPIVVHRDVKPSNILLDGDMEARVADFGVAKLIQTDESMSVIAGSYGYIAPEYAYTLQVDEKSDIYSFGVVLLELVTGRRSVEAEFGEAMNIVDWVRGKVQTKEGIIEILDQKVGAGCAAVREEMLMVLRVALLCTTRCPVDRPSMRDVVTMLSEAKPRRKSAVNTHCLLQNQQQLARSNPPSCVGSRSPSPAASKHFG